MALIDAFYRRQHVSSPDLPLTPDEENPDQIRVKGWWYMMLCKCQQWTGSAGKVKSTCDKLPH
jgi:hypothetical protein